MKVLPVLDVKNGLVVRGIAGRRDQYHPIVSQLTSSSDPFTVAHAIRNAFGLDQLYLADLDGILQQKPNFELYSQLIANDFDLLIDAGVRQPSEAIQLHVEGQIRVVVGLETCRSPDDLARIVARVSNVTFSLDLQNGVPRYAADACEWGNDLNEIVQQIVQTNVTSILVLDLSDVGMATGGSTDSLCQSIRQKFPNIQLIAGGGVRSRDDLNRLNQLGVDAVLVASALHDGRLVRSDLQF